MYRVLIEESNRQGVTKTLDLVMKTEKLYELLGRYMVKYGVPDELISERGITELEYYKTVDDNKNFIASNVSYCCIGKDNKKGEIVSSAPMTVNNTRHSNVTYIKPPVVPDEPPEERLQIMLEAGVLLK